jgi:NAD(P)-dependent dehydrogenase (short-subunit alcohol dehydrogenase family)
MNPRKKTASNSLAGHVAVVAGATRGAGRGCARALGEAGATVYCTGRSVRGQPSPYNRPETIEETAELVTAAGGAGIAVRVDHTVESEVRDLFDRVAQDHGRLDVLVNSIAGEDPLLTGWVSFLETDLAHADLALRQGLLSRVITVKYAAPLMIKKRRGLLVEVTEGDLLYGSGNALGQIVKYAIKGLPMMLAEELRKHRVAAITITPGFLRSESMLQHFGVTEANWRDAAKQDEHFLHSETPLFVGRAVAALAADPKVLARSGQLLSSWEVAREYGLTDADGTRPDWGKHGKEVVLPTLKWLREGVERHSEWLDHLAARAHDYLDSETKAPLAAR